MSSVRNENTQFKDAVTGELINNGYIYIGLQNLDPVLNPATIYPDRALAGIPLANPQRTGTDGRSLNKIWVEGKYSIKVTDSAGVQKLIDLDRGDDALAGNSLLINSLGVNDVVVTGSPTIQTLVDNQTYIFTAPAANTGAMTLKIDSLDAKPIKKAHDEAMAADDVKEDQKLVVIYNESDGIFELQSAVASSSFSNITVSNDATVGGDIELTGDIMDSAGNEIISLNETALAVNEINIANTATGSGPIISSAGGDTNIDLNLNPKGSGVLKSGGSEIMVTPAAVSGHVRAGNVQISDGSVAWTNVNVTSSVTEEAWETIGPTGSGADIEWGAMDVIPTNATIIRVLVQTQISTSGTATGQLYLNTASNSVAAPSAASPTYSVRYAVDHDANINGTGKQTTDILIPMDGSQIFQVYWNEISTDTATINLYYRGFITD